MMEACEKYREALSLMACGALAGDEEATLVRHVETCDACRRYYADMQQLSQSLKALGDETQGIAPPKSLYARVEHEVMGSARGEARPRPAALLAPSRGIAWRYAVAAACLVSVAAGAFYTAYRMLTDREEKNVAAPSRQIDKDLPYFAVYHQALGESPANLDELLEAHSKHRPHNYGDLLPESSRSSERGNPILQKERHDENMDVAGTPGWVALRPSGGRDC